jgi:ribosome assembly protein YihI (activator of Der GTPase)
MEDAEKRRRQKVQADLGSRNLGPAMMFLRNNHRGKFLTAEIAKATNISEAKVREELNAHVPLRDVKRSNKGFAKGARHGEVITDIWQYQLYGQERDQDWGV